MRLLCILIKFIEQFGTGTGRMIRLCREAGVPEPEFESRGGSFRILFSRTSSALKRFSGHDLSDRQLVALQSVLASGRMTRHQYEQTTGVKSATAKREISDLMKKGILAKKGGGRSFWYELADDIDRRGTARAANEPQMSRKSREQAANPERGEG